MTVLGFLKRFRRDQRGISAVEYAILIGVVGVGLVGVLSTASTSIGNYVSSQITDLTTGTDNAQQGDGAGAGAGTD